MDMFSLLQQIDDLADAAEDTPAAEEAMRLEILLENFLKETS